MRNSIYGRPKAQPEPSSQAQPLPPQPIRRENPQQSLSHNSAIQQYLNMRRITKDKGCLIIFIFYCIGLVIMMGIGFFFGNYSDLGYFVNDGAAVAEQRNCNSLYLSEDFTSCVDTCVSNFAFLKRVCIANPSAIYNPTLYDSVPGLIQMNNIKITFPMITYVSGGLLIATGILFILAISLPKIIYLYIFALFLMLLGMAFYLLKNFQLRIQSLSIQPGSIFYTEQQNTRAISFFLLGIYLLIFPFVLFSPKKIQLGTFLLSKISEFFKTMRKTIVFSMFVILVTWGSLIIEIFLVMHFYTSGQISQTPRASMFHTYDNINLSHPAALVFHFIGVFWFYATLISWHKYFISSAMCLWYFQDSQSMYQIRRGLKRSRHHVGTAALDGILLPFEWLFLFLYSVLKISDNESQQQYSCFRSIRQFFMSIYSSVNRCSPSSAVLTNQNYLQSSRTASQIFSTNSHRFFNIGGTLTIFLTLFTSILWLLIMYFIVYFEIYGKEFPSQITSVVLPVFCVFVIALVVGSLFANLFTASVDCLLFCYLMERKSLEEGEFQRDQGELKIKTVLDQCYYKSVEEAKTSVFIYQEKDENTLDVTYVAKKQ